MLSNLLPFSDFVKLSGVSLGLSSAGQCLLSWKKVSPAEGVVYEAQVKTTPTGGYQKVCVVFLWVSLLACLMAL